MTFTVEIRSPISLTAGTWEEWVRSSLGPEDSARLIDDAGNEIGTAHMIDGDLAHISGPEVGTDRESFEPDPEIPSHNPDLGDVVRVALENDFAVRLRLDDEYGYHIDVGGVSLTDWGGYNGLPWEGFGVSIDDHFRNPSTPTDVVDLLRSLGWDA